MSLPLLKKIN